MVLFEVDPSIIKPGWIPFVIVVALGIVIFLLYLSMRHQVTKIQMPPTVVHDELPRRDPEIDISNHGAPAGPEAGRNGRAVHRRGADNVTSRQRDQDDQTRRQRTGHDAG